MACRTESAVDSASMQWPSIHHQSTQLLRQKPTARAPRRASSLAWPGHLIEPHRSVSPGPRLITSPHLSDMCLDRGRVLDPSRPGKVQHPILSSLPSAAVPPRLSYVLITLLHLVSTKLPYSSPYPYVPVPVPVLLILAHDGEGRFAILQDVALQAKEALQYTHIQAGRLFRGCPTNTSLSPQRHTSSSPTYAR